MFASYRCGCRYVQVETGTAEVVFEPEQLCVDHRPAVDEPEVCEEEKP